MYAARSSRSQLALVRGGQVMILTVLALGGTILGATTIAGLLMVYQLRQSNDLANSARAIFAADAGMEWAFYNLFCANGADKSPCPAREGPSFTNGAEVAVICADERGEPLLDAEGGPDCANENVRRIRSVGKAGTASRAFEATF